MNRQNHWVSKAALLAIVLTSGRGAADDWPMWRCDSGRTGLTREQLPEKLKDRLGFKPWNAYGRIESPAAARIEPEPPRIGELVPKSR